MQILESVPLSEHTTMRVGGPARYLVIASNVEEVSQAISFARIRDLPVFILGGGSNVIFPDNGFNGLVIVPKILGKKIMGERNNHVYIEIGAGEVWDEVVAWTTDQGLWGIENLSAIPGLSGALAIQNVGAYGQEASQVVGEVEVLEIKTGAIRRIDIVQCSFAYRSSIFNTTHRGRYIILSIILRLRKEGHEKAGPNFNYKDLYGYFGEKIKNKEYISPKEMREAVIIIRSRKLPDINEVGSAGSFFKNITINQADLKDLETRIIARGNSSSLEKLHEVMKYDIQSSIRIPTAFFIEDLGLKGYRYGGARISEKHALVIENIGNATAQDVITLAHIVQQKIYTAFGVVVDIEPEIVNS